MPSVIIVGGGVIGATCACFLSREGWEVTVVDRGEFGKGCSHGNCGFVCPSHVLPLAEPGAIGRAVQAMLRPNSPFSIRPRLDWRLWAWMLGFARRCNRRDMLEAGAACHALLELSMSLYRDLMDREALECEWQTKGLLFAYRDKQEFDAYAEVDQLLSAKFYHPAVRYNGDDVCRLEPALKPGLAGGWHYEADAHLRPDRLMASWKRLLGAQGVRIVENCEVTGIAAQHGRALAVQACPGEIRADQFVIATGAWTPQLSRFLGCRIPIEPGKGYSLTMPRPEICPSIPMIFPETRVAVTPWESGYRLGSTMEFAGYDTTISPRRLELLTRGAEPYLREPAGGPVEEQWFGWRPMTYDSKPIIDRSPSLSNVVIATGHSMLGVSMAPGTARLVADLLAGRAPAVDVAPFRVTRF